MGNIKDSIPLMLNKLFNNSDDIVKKEEYILELEFRNEALESQIKLLKEMLKKDDLIIKNMDMELKQYKLLEDDNKCVICKYSDKIN